MPEARDEEAVRDEEATPEGEEAVIDEQLRLVEPGVEPRPGDVVWSMWLKQEVVFLQKVRSAKPGQFHWQVRDLDGKGHVFPEGSFRQ
jgi:hypothetical protein